MFIHTNRGKVTQSPTDHNIMELIPSMNVCHTRYMTSRNEIEKKRGYKQITSPRAASPATLPKGKAGTKINEKINFDTVLCGKICFLRREVLSGLPTPFKRH